MGLVIIEGIVAASVVRGVVQISEVSGGMSILDASFGYSHSQVLATFEAYGPVGLEAYQTVQLWDLLHPALYSLLLATLLFMAFRHTRWRWASLLPFAAAALDYAENAFLFIMTATFPDISTDVVAISNVLSIIKRLSLVPALAATVAAVVYRVTLRLRSAR